MTRGRARRYVLTKSDDSYYPQVVADAGYTVLDWSTLNAGTLFQDSAKTTPVTANSDPVGAWVDGVQGVDAIQATTASKPTYTTASLNGLPTLSFDGSDLLATGNIAISTFAVWVVFRSTAANTMIYEQSVESLSNNGMYLYNTSLNQMQTRANRTGRADKRNSAVTGVNYIISRHESNSTYATQTLYFNGALQTMTNVVVNDPGTATVTDALFIGARSGVSLPLTGNIAQLLIVSPYPTAQIIANMESYINGIWSVY